MNHPIADQNTLRLAAEHLQDVDPVLASLIRRAGLPTIKAHHNYYETLVGSVISQQLSVKAADTIERRFRELFGEEFPSPSQLLAEPIENLRSAGLSQAKANYIRDLAGHILSKELSFEHFDRSSNESIIKELTAVKGIGEWTAHMFLMFCMGRLDVLAPGDLGIRNGIGQLYGFTETPTPNDVIALAETRHWHPYETAACWYIWHHLDNKPAV